jgi:hypothetical protein
MNELALLCPAAWGETPLLKRQGIDLVVAESPLLTSPDLTSPGMDRQS